MDLANRSPEYLDELAKHHVGGHLKVAPEHVSERVLDAMKKPAQRSFETFAGAFKDASRRAGKNQYIVPYFIASHPGSTLAEAIELAEFLKNSGYRPRQVQDFIPAPMDIATCMYHTGLDPMTMKPVPVVTRLRDRVAQRALMQYFAPENWFAVHRALLDAGRRDLIGSGPRCLIPATPPPEALEARRLQAARAYGSDAEADAQADVDVADEPAAGAAYVHSEDAGTSPRATPLPPAPPAPRASVGYRPHRKRPRRTPRGGTPPA
jgi:hypothetical protein